MKTRNLWIGALVLMTIVIAILVIKIKKSSKESFGNRWSRKRLEMVAANPYNPQRNYPGSGNDNYQKFCVDGRNKGYCGASTDAFRNVCQDECAANPYNPQKHYPGSGNDNYQKFCVDGRNKGYCGASTDAFRNVCQDEC